MIKWLTSLFKGTSVPEVINEVAKEAPAPAPTPKKTATKKKPATKAAKVDVDGMSKKDLLAHAKKNGIKANASMNKAALVKAIKNGQ
jgi:hypothetical protein